ncbi:MAG: hypothetical protein LBH61_06320, partial [Dysgonamonadaceae bacterium]|nr:hypothetical protein [Dysgonamonadaceae bacterium]
RERNEEHFQFLLNVNNLLAMHPTVVGTVSSLMPEFTELLGKEGHLVDAIQWSAYTKKIFAADKRDLKKAVIRTIPDQVFAGVPVTVMPEVFFEGEQLVFAEDYEVTYKDNHQPGTAALIMHGKGAYKGKKSVSFNIVETGGAAANPEG